MKKRTLHLGSLLLYALIGVALSHAQDFAPYPAVPISPAEQAFADSLVKLPPEDIHAALQRADPSLISVGTARAVRVAATNIRLSQPQQALALYTEAAFLGGTLHDQRLIAASLMGEADVRRLTGDAEEAIKLLGQSESAYAAANLNPGILALPLNARSLAKRDLGDFEGSAEDALLAVQYSRQAGDRVGTARALNNFGTIRNMQGNYAAARQAFQEGLTLARSMNEKAGESFLLNNIADTYLAEKDTTLAIDYCLQSLKLKEELGNPTSLVSTLVNLANIYWQDDKLSEAMKPLDRALDLARQSHRAVLVSEVEASRGEVEMDQGRMDDAARDFDAALKAARESGTQFQQNEILALIAQLERRTQHYGEAVRDYDRVLDAAQQFGMDQIAADALEGKALADIGLGNTEGARRAFEQSVAITERQRELTAGGAEGRSEYLSRHAQTYQALIALDVSDGRVEDALQISEREKGRTLLDLLTLGKSTLSHELTPAEKEEEVHIRGRLTLLESRRQALAATDKPDAARIAALNLQLETARHDMERFKERMSAAHPDLNRHRGDAHLITLAQTASLFAGPSTAALEYEVTPDATFLFVLTRGLKGPVVTAHTIHVGQAALHAQVAALSHAVATRDPGFAVSASALYRLLLAPAHAELAHKQRLIVVPSGDLWQLPFQALRDANGKYLVDSASLAYAPSLSVLHAYESQKRAPRPRASLVAFGDPGENLPEAAREVKTVAALYSPGRQRTFLGKQATRENFTAWAGHYDIVHVAAHGLFDDHDPMYSQVLLAAGADASSSKSTPLDASEIADMNLSSTLVVLSACETAKGRVRDGEGLIGLSWSFLAAGSQAAIASQWRVESSSTTELMIAFHRNLQQHMGKAEALRRAELSVAHDPRYQHPFYWAGFVLLGED